jgi:hypothetical protein
LVEGIRSPETSFFTLHSLGSPRVRGDQRGNDTIFVFRRVTNGEQTRTVAALAMRKGPSVDFSGYWQRHVHAA